MPKLAKFVLPQVSLWITNDPFRLTHQIHCEIVIPRGLKIRPVAVVQRWREAAAISVGAATWSPEGCAGMISQSS
jgi:hypothetical protein